MAKRHTVGGATTFGCRAKGRSRGQRRRSREGVVRGGGNLVDVIILLLEEVHLCCGVDCDLTDLHVVVGTKFPLGPW